MFRYIALTWDARIEQLNATANALTAGILDRDSSWQLGINQPGLRVYYAGLRRGSSEVYRLSSDAGVVLGTVFHSVDEDGTVPHKANFSEKVTASIVGTRGRYLVEHYWGRYVAFIFREADKSSFVIRSPTGELDCFSTNINGVRVFFSDADQCPPLEAIKFTINWNYVASDLCTTLPETRETGMNEIQRVLHGECIECRGLTISRKSYWNPCDVASAVCIEDPTFAIRKVRSTTQAVIGAWASCYPSVLALLSGGFDSSVLVSLLYRAPTRPRVTCLNNRNPYDSVTDERRYARLVSERFGYALVEHEERAEFSLELLYRLPKLPSPCQPAFEIGSGEQRAAIAAAHEATAYFSGHGGDQLFFQRGGYFPCADYVYTHGLRPRIFSLALDAARIAGGALLPAIRSALRNGLRRDPLDALLSTYRFSPLVPPNVAEHVRALRLYVPACFARGPAVPLGKCWQIIGLSRRDTMHGVYAYHDYPENVYPFLSQPLQELCLQIATYVLTLGGRSRGLARAAFRADVPAEIINRNTKGFVSDYLKAIVARNAGLMRSIVLDGALVKEQLIDRAKFDRVLSGDQAIGGVATSHLLQVAATEAWIHSWRTSRVKAAA